MEKLRIVVGGFIGLLPAGGITWDYVQYPIGFAELGHDVYYIEDTRLFPIYQNGSSSWDDASGCVKHLKQVMEYFGLKDKWAYRDEASGNCYGLSEEKVKEICRTADLFVNISCSTFLRDEYANIPNRLLIDSDPMFTQIQYVSQQMFAPGESRLRELINNHNHLFTFGENIYSADCRIPIEGLHWKTTRQPICLKYWKQTPLPDTAPATFTTLMNWSAGKRLIHQNEEWGQKDIEFQHVVEIPKRFPEVQLSLVINSTEGSGQTYDPVKISASGWQVIPPDAAAGNWFKYSDFIQSSVGEFSVAKNTYVKANTGWFSCRSACYLAAGRPVVTQDTGWSRYIPSGKGLFAFNDFEGAESALKEVIANKEKHSKHARQVAEEYFDSKKVLQALLNNLS